MDKQSAIDAVHTLPIQFDPYSHWPLAWHAEVFHVLEAAVAHGIPNVYVKVKLGGLRIQGEQVRFVLREILNAESACRKICACCGQPCDPPPLPDIPRCASCLQQNNWNIEYLNEW